MKQVRQSITKLGPIVLFVPFVLVSALIPRKTENLEPWSHIFYKAEKRHETQLNELIYEYEGNGDSENVARVKAENALFPVYNLKIQKDMIGWNWQN